MTDRFWLDVAYEDKDQAKAGGARWDNDARRWYAPEYLSEAQAFELIDRWPALGPWPEVLDGEDRGFGTGLFVDLVPRSCWFTNARSALPPPEWEALSRHVRDRAERACEVCGGNEARMEAHERWSFNGGGGDEAGVQVLRRLICLCSSCHEATHMGLAQLNGRETQALAHLAQVNGWSLAQAQRHTDEAFEVWARRSATVWELDLSVLRRAGLHPRAPGPPAGLAPALAPPDGGDGGGLSIRALDEAQLAGLLASLDHDPDSQVLDMHRPQPQPLPRYAPARPSLHAPAPAKKHWWRRA